AEEVRAPRLAGLPVLRASILSPYVQERIELSDISRLLALTPNEELNALATLHFARDFGREEVYQLAPEEDGAGQDGAVTTAPRAQLLTDLGRPLRGLASQLDDGPRARPTQKVARELQGRVLFGPGVTFERLRSMLEAGATSRRTSLTSEFTYDDFRAVHGAGALPLFLIDEAGRVTPLTADVALTPQAGQALISLVPARPDVAR
ncbi:MAG TPA: hypothetical protein VF590_16995, partial [Isosphaeraceae bacterium]